MAKNRKKPWNEYLWIASIVYLVLGVFNILFAWLGLLCFIIPLIISFAGMKDMKEVVTLLWTWKMPWQWVNTSFVSPWVAQFAFGFYSIMLTSTILGVITMILYKPRSWCVYCPMGTATQAISSIKYNKNK